MASHLVELIANVAPRNDNPARYDTLSASRLVETRLCIPSTRAVRKWQYTSIHGSIRDEWHQARSAQCDRVSRSRVLGRERMSAAVFTGIASAMAVGVEGKRATGCVWQVQRNSMRCMSLSALEKGRTCRRRLSRHEIWVTGHRRLITGRKSGNRFEGRAI